MGLCALDETLRWILPPMDACEKWENTIKKCVAQGMYHLKKRLCIDILNNIFVYIRVVLIKVFCYITVQCQKNSDCPIESPACYNGLCEGITRKITIT